MKILKHYYWTTLFIVGCNLFGDVRSFEIAEQISFENGKLAFSLSNVLPRQMLQQHIESQLAEWRDKLTKPDWGYPGLMYKFKPKTDNFPMPAVLDATVSQILGPIAKSQHWLSIITLKENQLNQRQSIPHVDSSEGLGIYSSVLYLFNSSEFGGTLFFGKSDNDRQKQRKKFVPSYANCTHPPSFHCVGQINAAYNTMALYPSSQLHAASIPNAAALTNDPAQGRLTLTSMFHLKPPAQKQEL